MDFFRLSKIRRPVARQAQTFGAHARGPCPLPLPCRVHTSSLIHPLTALPLHFHTNVHPCRPVPPFLKHSHFGRRFGSSIKYPFPYRPSNPAPRFIPRRNQCLWTLGREASTRMFTIAFVPIAKPRTDPNVHPQGGR